MIEVDNLCKAFRWVKAVDGISFCVRQGEVLGFLGPNGAGKSTTMRMITGFLSPTSGHVRVAGFDMTRRPLEGKRCVGYLPEGSPAYGDMTPAGFLDFVAGIRKLTGLEKKRCIEAAVALLHIEKIMYRPIETLSKGFKRRVGLAQAILHDPDILILDEPTDGLDPNQKQDVRALIRHMAPRKAIILSTHILEEIQPVCTRVAVIARGRLLADETPDAFASRSRYHNAVTLGLNPAQANEARHVFGDHPDVLAVETLLEGPDHVELRLLARSGTSLAAVVGAIAHGRGWSLEKLYVDRGHLDEAFHTLTQAGHAQPS
ncbi:MAG: ABC transporter ATP-binding protein [Magnetococcales bacterium]|nr:ABC transporter ATP-binding protein [Magnetococcales bacterium]MBF0321771.1 ABC transporter ATP-binding protein [Magnetococcales bacterium]